MEIPPPPGQADYFINVSAGFSELDEQAAEPQGCEFSFQRMGRDEQVPLGSANRPNDSAKPGDVRQLEVDHVCKRNEFQKEKNPLAGAPIESASLFPCAESQNSGARALGEGFLNGICRNPLRQKKVQSNFHKIHAVRGSF